MNKKLGAIFYPRPFGSDFIPHILKELYVDGVYSPYVIGKTDITVFDLGAHIGLFSMYMQRFAKVVHAVEPDSENYAALKENIKHNGWNVRTYKAAIGLKDAILPLYHFPNKTAHSIEHAMNAADKEDVPVWSFDTLFKVTGAKQVDFLKMDIEGSEFDVLASASFKKHAPKIKLIAGEIHDRVGRNFNQVKWSLIDAGFTFHTRSTEATVFVAVREK